MAENKDGSEKSEDATRKRLEDGRDKGQVSKSSDVTTSVVLLIGGVSVFVFGIPLINNYMSFMTQVLQNSAQINMNYENFISYYPKVIGYVAGLVLPVILIIFFLVLTSEVSQVGLKVAWKKFEEFEDLKKIFKIGAGLKKIFFSSRSIFELVKNFAKIGFLGAIIISTLYGNIEDVLSMVEKPYMEIGSLMSSLALEILLKMGIVYILIAVSDYIYQKWKFKEDMKMTKQEVKDEHKQMEGDPKVKGQFRSLMRQRVRKAMISSVADADVIITNPTHFAVAIKYDQSNMFAPKVIAKGADFIAQQIREKAKENNVIIYEEPPLARALYYNVDINQDIPEDLFKAVAEVLAYVYSLNEKKAN
jgi:flagellar biosynthetic protein FlhB